MSNGTSVIDIGIWYLSLVKSLDKILQNHIKTKIVSWDDHREASRYYKG